MATTTPSYASAKDAIMAHIAALVDQRDAARAQASDLGNKLATMEADLQLTITERDRARDHRDDALDDLRDADDEIMALTRMLRRADREIEGLSLDLRDAERDIKIMSGGSSFIASDSDAEKSESLEAYEDVMGDDDSCSDSVADGSVSLADSEDPSDESPTKKRRRFVIDSDSE